MRHAIKRGFWRPLLVVLGATAKRSYVQVDEEQLEVRFGSFRQRISLQDVASARRAAWPWIGGIGWRLGRRSVGLIGSLEGVVAIQLRQPQRARVILLPYTFERIYVSLEDPAAFLAELGGQGRSSSLSSFCPDAMLSP